jgi:exoribonuclease R
MYSFIPENRDYTKWSIVNNIAKQQQHAIPDPIKHIDPSKQHLFPDDILDKDGLVIESPYKKKTNIPGVLVLRGKTYGPTSAAAQTHTKTTKYYYKCIPYDKRLPSILIPYRDKATGFSKHKVNIYVLFKIDKWTDKHPVGTLTNVLGSVDKIEHFNDYQLYARDLAVSMQGFNKEVSRVLLPSLPDKIIQEDPILEDRRERNIYSIDPEGTKDIDDAIGIHRHLDICTISIYIANVPYWLDKLGLWGHLTDRVSTIYLPNKTIHMLPTKLSEDLLSLLHGKERVAFVMDIVISDDVVLDVKFSAAKIKVTTNFAYEDKQLLKNKDYRQILSITKQLVDNKKNIAYVDHIADSHDVVEYYMLMMNHASANHLWDIKKGIYRTVKNSHNPAQEAYPPPTELKSFINIWKNTTSQYTTYQDHTGHTMVAGGIDKYLQITSPIRRLCDIVNMTELLVSIGKINKTPALAQTILRIVENIEYLNQTSKNIRKVQTECKLLNYCLDMGGDNNVVDGYIIDIIDHEKYTVYVPELQLITKVKTSTGNESNDKTKYKQYKQYEKHKFGVYVFTDEHSFHKKIRVNIK